MPVHHRLPQLFAAGCTQYAPRHAADEPAFEGVNNVCGTEMCPHTVLEFFLT